MHGELTQSINQRNKTAWIFFPYKPYFDNDLFKMWLLY